MPDLNIETTPYTEIVKATDLQIGDVLESIDGVRHYVEDVKHTSDKTIVRVSTQEKAIRFDFDTPVLRVW